MVGSHETGIKINRKKSWFWTWQNSKLTYIFYSDNRGFDSIQTNFENSFKNAALVHDCWSSHFKTVCKTNQICTALLLRELVFFEEKYQNLIKASDEVLMELKKLLEKFVPKKHKELFEFHKRMTKYKDFIFSFLHFHEVPPDNNGSERAIKNVEVKQKISGQFKTEKGAQKFAGIRSLTDTCKTVKIFWKHYNYQYIEN